ncbi:DNA gyrase inhibitor YacG [Proteus mirabilis]|uniref:DNA gyrase inhibitor YacG n=1 Tax=Proteus mirabilis TaxID=584 RepID=UPI001E614A15|nr:DNA gyrase inhibitor YacG [Proteus mirabilis]MCD4625977.1 DNA gyrase inhibitor YacG [Proteus mirabilis]
MSEKLIVKCPTCRTEVIWDESSPYRPFCCKRCQLIDLGEWAAEEKRIPSQCESYDCDVWSDMRELDPKRFN